jgi:hypothetical protein
MPIQSARRSPFGSDAERRARESAVPAIERVTRSRHALVHEGKFYCQLAPESRPASLPPLASAADEYYFLIGFLDRVLLALPCYQGPYLDWGVAAGQQPRRAHFP